MYFIYYKYTICCKFKIFGVDGMECPYCHHIETKVTDSRDTGSITIRRRRECLKCNKRFTTYENIEMTPIYIIKKDGRREKFDRNKIKKGIMKALEKRPVSHEKIDNMINSIEEKIHKNGKEEIESSTIGEYVMNILKETDQVAYIRFASVYRSFADITFFEKEIKNLAEEKIIEER
jgi:transcriptional repressor NrdR